MEDAPLGKKKAPKEVSENGWPGVGGCSFEGAVAATSQVILLSRALSGISGVLPASLKGIPSLSF